MSQIVQRNLKIPKCIHCAFYQPNAHQYNKCNRVFIREHPKLETIYYPLAITARSYNYMCNIEGRYFVHTNVAKHGNSSHMIG
jgi:hypothetical protein